MCDQYNFVIVNQHDHHHWNKEGVTSIIKAVQKLSHSPSKQYHRNMEGATSIIKAVPEVSDSPSNQC